MASPHTRTGLTALLLVAGLTLAGCQKVPPPPPVASDTSTSRSAGRPPNQPFVKQHIYSETADPRADIAAALKQAKTEHKRVIIDFGGDWCGDCQVLDLYLHQNPNSDLLAKNFVLAHVFVDSDIDNNLDLGMKYGIPLKKGVPALAVLDANGNILYSQKNGEFEKMRQMDIQSVTDFLNRWKS